MTSRSSPSARALTLGVLVLFLLCMGSGVFCPSGASAHATGANPPHDAAASSSHCPELAAGTGVPEVPWVAFGASLEAAHRQGQVRLMARVCRMIGGITTRGTPALRPVTVPLRL